MHIVWISAVQFITSICIYWGMLKVWPIHAGRIDPIGQLTRYLCTCSIYTVYINPNLSELVTTTSPSFNEKPFYTSYGLLLVIIQILHLHTPKLHFHTQQYSDQVTMAPELNNAHITYYHMDAAWSVGLAWNYSTHSIWPYKVGFTPPVYIQTPFTKQGHRLFVILSSFLGVWATWIWAPHVTTSWL